VSGKLEGVENVRGSRIRLEVGALFCLRAGKFCGLNHPIEMRNVSG